MGFLGFTKTLTYDNFVHVPLIACVPNLSDVESDETADVRSVSWCLTTVCHKKDDVRHYPGLEVALK